ncbi:hypothetical protein KFL_007250060 [Klebsormidium nitens]|uniref:Uncharacterized protein n=1 Tax=Klebsormidium nitens TaxID=105231 RepID=A0A1Y1IJL3_KLENI|nr:hypothetical protein KFL_007250060 [Klebsormidium nitens]|eukprot:GAQ91085.1 hypothetical protein KFL_007250060 [Klebsormidium nitens]
MKVSSQARRLMLIHTEDAYVKLIEGEPTAEKAWKKLEDTFEKRSNARMIQLRRKLTGEQKPEKELRLRAEAGSLVGISGGAGAVAYAAKHRGYSSSEKGRGSSNELKRSSGIETVGKHRAFRARGPLKGNRVCATAKRPVRAESVVNKTVKVVEVDLDESDDENGGAEREWGTVVGADEAPRTCSNFVEKGAEIEMTREGEAHAPATYCGRAARTDSKRSQCGPIVEVCARSCGGVRGDQKGQRELKDGGGEQARRCGTACNGEAYSGDPRVEKICRESATGDRRMVSGKCGSNNGSRGAEVPEHGVEKTSPEKSDDGKSEACG